MKDTGMQRSVFLGLAFLMALSAACLDPEGIDPEEAGDLVDREHHPFYVATFDHEPTEDELQADLARFLAAAADGQAGTSRPWDPIDPVPLPLQLGQKLVRIDARTSNVANAGTNDASQVRFYGAWERSSGGELVQYFVLNHPTRDDLNRNTVDVFYYVLNMGQGVTDRFMQGMIANFSTDGWHCNQITLIESNRQGTTRSQSLPFNQLVDYPSPIMSSWFAGTSNAWLAY